MTKPTPNAKDDATKKEDEQRPAPLEARYGAIGCAAVKAASMLARGKGEEKKSKGFASQTRG